MAEEEENFFLFGYLKKLKQSRRCLIENIEQYGFIYDTLEEHVINGYSWFSVTELSDKLKEKSKKDPVSKMNEYQKEYLQIVKQTSKFTIVSSKATHSINSLRPFQIVRCFPLALRQKLARVAER